MCWSNSNNTQQQIQYYSNRCLSSQADGNEISIAEHKHAQATLIRSNQEICDFQGIAVITQPLCVAHSNDNNNKHVEN